MTAADQTPAAPATPVGGRSTEQYRAVVDSLRTRVDLFGKTLAAFATLGTGAVGLAKVGDLFPHDGQDGWFVAAIVGLLAAAAGALTVAVRLMNVGQPLVVEPDLGATKWRRGERALAEEVFTASARRFGYTSLVGLQVREQVLRSTAARARSKDELVRRMALADDVRNEIDGALARTQLVVVRRRATRAVSGVASVVCYGLVAVGLLTFALGADAVASERTDPIAIAKSCGEAREAGATDVELADTACGVGDTEDADGTTPPPTAEEALADLGDQLAQVWKGCASLSADGAGTPDGRPLTAADCRAVRRALLVVARRRAGDG